MTKITFKGYPQTYFPQYALQNWHLKKMWDDSASLPRLNRVKSKRQCYQIKGKQQGEPQSHLIEENRVN